MNLKIVNISRVGKIHRFGKFIDCFCYKHHHYQKFVFSPFSSVLQLAGLSTTSRNVSITTNKYYFDAKKNKNDDTWFTISGRRRTTGSFVLQSSNDLSQGQTRKSTIISNNRRNHIIIRKMSSSDANNNEKKSKDSDDINNITAALATSTLNDTDQETKSQSPTFIKNDSAKVVEQNDSRIVPDSIKQFVQWIQDGTVKNILVVAGAGMSVSAGIPDFRTPGTGLYDNLQLYNLPYAEAIFDIDYYQIIPFPFIRLSKAIWPGQSTGPVPTITHTFLYLLSTKQLLQRIYTQNIDGLEYLANIDEKYIVECHGHFRTASCIQCHASVSNMEQIRHIIVEEEKVPLCPICYRSSSNSSSSNKKKGTDSTTDTTTIESMGIKDYENDNDKNWSMKKLKGAFIKPDIVFFGEGLPNRFHQLVRTDTKTADCCLIIGTSLQVGPVNQIPEMVHRTLCKRVLFNKELVGSIRSSSRSCASSRDIYQLGDCDDTIMMVAELLGWKEELLMEHERAVSNIHKRQKQQQQQQQQKEK